MANLPTDIVQQAFDAVGIEHQLGDIQDGSNTARVALRAYSQCRRQLLRTARWDWARKQTDLTLLADASGNTPDVGTNVPQIGFIYEYAYPNDCLQARFIPWNWPVNGPVPSGNIVPVNPSSPQTTGMGALPIYGRQPPTARFVITNDPNYPPTPGMDPDALPQGSSPVSQIVILTNVQYAQLVYTQDVIYPSQWDALFREAMVSYIAQQVVVALSKEKMPIRLRMRADQIALTKQKIEQARLIDGNEGTLDSSLRVNWMQGRMSGGPGFGFWGADWAGQGGWGFPWASAGFADGTAF